ncbi:hypothetical protein AAEX28_13210 [Lentisphaerota bacterium WC36G]|nr:hypothetical protein LJT99_16040 [Lentisphaerae bacterium WC36]
MKLYKKIEVNGVEYPLISEQITLEFNNSGRGLFIVESKQNLTGELKYYAGWNGQYSLIFTGDIESCISMDNKQERLFVREKSNKLCSIYQISMRLCTTLEIIKKLAALSSLEFIVQDAPWSTFEMPFFSSTGTGWQILSQLIHELEIENCSVNSLADGRIFFGGQKKNTLHFDIKHCSEITATGVTLMLNPFLYCGQEIIIGHKEPRQIFRLNIANETTRIEFP